MRALSLDPDYAIDVLLEMKTVEWRSWKTEHRGDLLICANSKKRPMSITGHAICVVTLDDVVPFEKKHLLPAQMDEIPDKPNNWAWLFSNVRLIKPFPVKGKLHLYDVDDKDIVFLDESIPKWKALMDYYEPLMNWGSSHMTDEEALTLWREIAIVRFILIEDMGVDFMKEDLPEEAYGHLAYLQEKLSELCGSDGLPEVDGDLDENTVAPVDDTTVPVTPTPAPQAAVQQAAALAQQEKEQTPAQAQAQEQPSTEPIPASIQEYISCYQDPDLPIGAYRKPYVLAELEPLQVTPEEYQNSYGVEIIERMKHVLEVEAPIEKQRLFNVVRQSFGIARSGANIQLRNEELFRHVPCKSTDWGDATFLWRMDQDPNSYETYRDASQAASLQIDQIPFTEIHNAMREELNREGSLNRDDLIYRVAGLLGYKRVGARILETLNNAIDAGIAQNKFLELHLGIIPLHEVKEHYDEKPAAPTPAPTPAPQPAAASQVEVPRFPRLKNFEDASFREFVHEIAYFEPKDKRRRPESVYPHQQYEGTLAYGFVDPQKGLSFALLAPATYEEGQFYVGQGIPDVLSVTQSEAFHDAMCLTKLEVRREPYEQIIAMADANFKSAPGVEHLRTSTMLDPLRHPDFPDDIKVVFSKQGFEPETMWVRLVSYQNGITRGQLLNTPNQPLGVQAFDMVTLEFYVDQNSEHMVARVNLA